jgi:hypothetical protein
MRLRNSGASSWLKVVINVAINNSPVWIPTVISTLQPHLSGEPDPVYPIAIQHAVQDLPEGSLLFLLGSRYCDTDHLSEIAWNLFAGSPLDGGVCRRFATSFMNASNSATNMAARASHSGIISATGSAFLLSRRYRSSRTSSAVAASPSDQRRHGFCPCYRKHL